MASALVVSDREIEEILDTCAHFMEIGDTFDQELSYEEGVIAAIEWLTIEGTASPFEDGDVEAAYDAESDSDKA